MLSLLIARLIHIPRNHLSRSPEEIARSEVQGNQVTAMVLDLRMKGSSRGDTPNRQGDDAPPRFPRTRLSLSIQLPIGSEDGIYDVGLINSVGQSVLETRGEAKLQNYIVVLPVEVNLTNLAPGLYRLRLRRAQTQWNSYSILLE